MQWYYVANGQRQGPISQAEFERLVADGTIKGETLVWREGMREWQPYSTMAPTPVGAGAANTDANGEETQVCAVSGKRYPVREMIQYDGKWISAEHRDEHFQRLREGVAQPGISAVPGPYGYGGFWRRVVAYVVDSLVLSVPIIILAVILIFRLVAVKKSPPEMVEDIRAFQLLINLISIAIGLSYEVFFVRKYDATPGKMALGVKILRSDGSKLSVGRIIGRYFGKMLSGLILFIGFIMVGGDHQKRGLHDQLCDTRVVKTRA